MAVWEYVRYLIKYIIVVKSTMMSVRDGQCLNEGREGMSGSTMDPAQKEILQVNAEVPKVPEESHCLGGITSASTAHQNKR